MNIQHPTPNIQRPRRGFFHRIGPVARGRGGYGADCEPCRTRNRSGGFTLVEIALAIFVVAIGVLAMAALFSAGLSASAKAVADTQSATLAKAYFNGLRSGSLRAAEQQATSNRHLWEEYWHGIGTGTVVKVAIPPVWTSGGSNLAFRVGGPYTQVFRNVSMHDSSIAGIVNHVLRYSNQVTMVSPISNTPPFVGYPLTPPPSGNWVNRAKVTMYIWDGEFGVTDPSDALIFYSEFNNQGDL